MWRDYNFDTDFLWSAGDKGSPYFLLHTFSMDCQYALHDSCNLFGVAFCTLTHKLKGDFKLWLSQHFKVTVLDIVNLL